MRHDQVCTVKDTCNLITDSLGPVQVQRSTLQCVLGMGSRQRRQQSESLCLPTRTSCSSCGCKRRWPANHCVWYASVKLPRAECCDM